MAALPRGGDIRSGPGATLSEECAEIVKAVGKIMRHGYSSRNPTVADSLTNREDLEREIGDALWAVDLMAHAGDISILRARSDQGRHRRKRRYLHHQQYIWADSKHEPEPSTSG